MGLFDSTPKWLHSDEVKRQKALSKIIDPIQLKEIILHPDAARDVRLGALDKLDEQALLYEVAASTVLTEDLRLMAVKKITDPKLLIALALDPTAPHAIQLAAVDGLHDEKWLTEVAVETRDELVFESAFSRISNQENWSRIAIEAKTEDFILRALVGITESEALGDALRYTSEDPRTIKLGLEKIILISDEYDLAQIAKFNESEVGVAAAKRLTDPEHCTSVAQWAFYEETKRVAIEQLNDQALLTELLDSFYDEEELKAHILGKLQAQGGLLPIIQSSYNEDNRLQAFEGIKDQESLAQIALSYTAQSGRVREEEAASFRLRATEQLTVEELLVSVATSEQRDAAELALLKLTSQNALAQVACAAEHEDIAAAACKRIVDSDALLMLVQTVHNKALRKEAFDRLSNEREFLEVATKNSDASLRLAALQRIKDQKIIKDVAKNDGNEKVRSTAINMLEDEETLRWCAVYDGSETVRLAVLQRLNDEELSEELALKDPSETVRLAALQRLNDEGLVEELALKDSNESVRQAALEKVKNQEVLVKVARKDTSDQIRLSAVSLITDIQLLFSLAEVYTKSGMAKPAALRLAELVSSDEDINRLCELIMSFYPSSEDTIATALIALSGKSPRAIQSLWPQISGWANSTHEDQAWPHSDYTHSSHYDGRHTATGLHSDGRSYSDCAGNHDDTQAGHVDNGGKSLLSKLPRP